MAPRAPFTFLGVQSDTESTSSGAIKRTWALSSALGVNRILNLQRTNDRWDVCQRHGRTVGQSQHVIESLKGISLSTKKLSVQKAKDADYILLNARLLLPCLRRTVIIVLHLPNESRFLPPA